MRHLLVVIGDARRHGNQSPNSVSARQACGLSRLAKVTKTDLFCARAALRPCLRLKQPGPTRHKRCRHTVRADLSLPMRADFEARY
jgi:hypothetical protein